MGRDREISASLFCTPSNTLGQYHLILCWQIESHLVCLDSALRNWKFLPCTSQSSTSCEIQRLFPSTPTPVLWLRRPGQAVFHSPTTSALPAWSLCLIKSQRRQKGRWALIYSVPYSSTNNTLYVMVILRRDVCECWCEPMRTPKLYSAWTRQKNPITFCVFLPLTYFFVMYPIRSDIRWEFFFGISPLCLLPD